MDRSWLAADRARMLCGGGGEVGLIRPRCRRDVTLRGEVGRRSTAPPAWPSAPMAAGPRRPFPPVGSRHRSTAADATPVRGTSATAAVTARRRGRIMVSRFPVQTRKRHDHRAMGSLRAPDRVSRQSELIHCSGIPACGVPFGIAAYGCGPAPAFDRLPLRSGLMCCCLRRSRYHGPSSPSVGTISAERGGRRRRVALHHPSRRGGRAALGEATTSRIRCTSPGRGPALVSNTCS